MWLTLSVAFLQINLAFAAIPDRDKDGNPTLRSESVVVRIVDGDRIVLRKNPDVVRPIASVTKLLSGIVLAGAPAADDLPVTIGEEDKDRVKWSRSRLWVGLVAPWGQLIRAALGASDNRAMYAAVRATSERKAFVGMMNRTAHELGMSHSSFVDPAGIEPGNVSTASDLLHLLAAAADNEQVRGWTKVATIELQTDKGVLTLNNPDRLVRSGNWDVIVGKTGYTVEAGRALVVRVKLLGHVVDMVFLGSREMASVFGDAGRVKRWLLPQLESSEAASVQTARAVKAAPSP